MTKAKYLIITVLLVGILFFIPNISNAAVEYTRTVAGNDGSITLNLTGLELDTSKAYSYALVTRGGTPSTWHTLTEYTTDTAKVNLSSATSDIVEVLKVTDTGVLYLKDDTDDTYMVDALEVNLKLPLLQAINYTKSTSNWYSIKKLYGALGGEFTGNSYYQLKKVTDKTFVEKFLDIKNNGGDITTLEEILPEVPITGYESDGYFDVDKNDGLYLLWIKITGDNCKEVFGCIIHDGLPDATTAAEYLAGVDVTGPVVESISVTSPTSGTYKTGQTIKIVVTFDENITGTTVPTLKIRFGTSAERALTNGTISGKTITYTYNIATDDKGQLAVTGFSGGTIKDASGNDATITSKTISGNTIKANEEGAIIDNGNNNQNNNQNGESTNNGSTNQGNNDTTLAPGTLPHAGLSITLVCVIALIIVGAMFAFFKYNKLKDI